MYCLRLTLSLPPEKITTNHQNRIYYVEDYFVPFPVKPGLYKLVSQGKNMLIVESLADKKRFPAYGNEKIISLGDIAMYTDTEDVPLKEVLLSMKKKENGAAVVMDLKKATADDLRAYLAEVLPTFDRDRVYPSDIKKLIVWYNLLVASGMTDFEETPAAETKEESKAE